jgi:hypothetical protein
MLHRHILSSRRFRRSSSLNLCSVAPMSSSRSPRQRQQLIEIIRTPQIALNRPVAAMGLNIPIIWTCKDTSMKDLHFDTRQFPHIVWTNSEDLYNCVPVTRLEAPEGSAIHLRGPCAASRPRFSMFKSRFQIAGEALAIALFMDGKLDADAFEHMSSARRWRRHAAFTSR